MMTLRFLAIPGCCCAGLGLGLEQGEPLRRKFITTSDVCFEVEGSCDPDNGVIAHALVPVKMVREFATSVQSVRF